MFRLVYEILRSIFEKLLEPPELRRLEAARRKNEMKKETKPAEPDHIRDAVADRAAQEITKKLPVPPIVEPIAETGIRAGIKALWRLFKKKKGTPPS